MKFVFRSAFICVLLPLVFLPADEADVKALYTKTEQQIAMRDGVKLFAAIYAPKDQSQKYPIMLSRTPYSVGPYGPDAYKQSLGPSALFLKEKYIFVYEDVRGKFMSEGEFVDMRPHIAKKSGPKDGNCRKRRSSKRARISGGSTTVGRRRTPNRVRSI